MHSYFLLTKTFLTAIGGSTSADKKRKALIIGLSIFAVFGILLPVAFAVGAISYMMTGSLKDLGATNLGINLIFHILSLFSVIFGINIVFNEFYFSSDISYILPWPLRAYQIVAAKFTATYIIENSMQFLMVLAAIIGYAIAVGISVPGILFAAVGIVTMPILPLAYCGIFSILIMGATRIIRNKDLIQRISEALMFLMFVGLVASIGFLQTMDFEQVITSFAQGKHTVMAVLDYIFPMVPLLTKAFGQGSAGAFLLYMVITLVSVVVMLILAQLLYFRGVLDLTSSPGSRHRRSLRTLLLKSKQSSAFRSLVRKEIRILWRTPAFFTNCVAIHFIWPLFVIAIYKLSRNQLNFNAMRTLYSLNNSIYPFVLVTAMEVIACIVTAIGSIASDGFSREGKQFYFMQYIPVSYKDQWEAKLFVANIFPFFGILLYFIPFCIYAQLPFVHVGMMVVNVYYCIHLVNMISLYIDATAPKLIWDDEFGALRENYNVFFGMAVAIGMAAAFCGVNVLFFMRTLLSVELLMLIEACVLVVALILFHVHVHKNIVEKIAGTFEQ